MRIEFQTSNMKKTTKIVLVAAIPFFKLCLNAKIYNDDSEPLKSTPPNELALHALRLAINILKPYLHPPGDRLTPRYSQMSPHVRLFSANSVRLRKH